MSVASYFSSLDYAPAPEGTAEALAWLKRHERFGHFIGGKWVKGETHFNTINPATGDVLASIAQGTADDVASAVKAARKALKPWQALGGHGRARHLYALARMVQRHARLLAVVETLDNGKTIRETRDIDVPLVARHFYHHAGWAEVQETEFPHHEPIGVVGQIVPWNFPLLMLAWKVAPALALGNTVVLKPAEFTPLTALLFAELAQQAGLPPGVLNIVTGDGVTGAALVAADVEKIAFTGSTEVGRLIRQQTAGSGKALTLELGGKSPFIVFDDADLDAAVEGVVDSIFFNQGQVCCAGSRLLLQEGIAERFLARLKARMEKLRLGSPLDKSSDMGAIVAPVQRERIAALVASAAGDGGTVFQAKCPAGGCFYPPTLITGLGTASRLMNEEIFGPVVVSLTFRTPDEAVQLANHSRYGLAASVWSQTIGLALDVAPKLDTGVVWVNGANLFDAAAPFGGVKESGFGREGGRAGCYAYLRPKGWADRKLRAAPKPQPRAEAPADFAMPALDRTAKLYIGGKQVRPDGNFVQPVFGAKGEVLGEVGIGSRKDIRNAVSAARGAAGWGKASGHGRAQVLYFLAENLSARGAEFATRLRLMTGASAAKAEAEVDAAIRRLFRSAAMADKCDGRVQQVPLRGAVLATNEPVGVVGVLCPDEQPLLSFVALMGPLIAMGNRVVMVPSERHALIATDFYQLLETSDVPAGVVNIVTGNAATLGKTLAEHDDVDSLWAFGDGALTEMAERLSTGNLKRTFGDDGRMVAWENTELFDRLIRESLRVKTIWIPWGE